MKNINLTPTSSKPDKVVRGNKPFILSSLIVLMLLCFVYFLRLTPFGKQWVIPYEDKIVTSISSLIGGKKQSEKKERIALNKRSSGKEESVDRQPISQKETGKKEKVGIEKKDALVEKAERKGVETQIKVEPVAKTSEKGIQKEEAEKVAAEEKKTIPVGIKEAQVPERSKTAKVASAKIPSKPISKKGSNNNNEIAGDHYYIQVCSCVLKDNAEQAFRRLDYLGFSPIMKETVGRTMMHNIYMDQLKKVEALRLLDQLKGHGFDPVLLPGSSGKYRLRVASCFYGDSAQKIIEKLTHLGYHVNILKETTPTKMYSVLLGQYRNMDEAEGARRELKSNGFQSPILKRMPQT